MTNRWLAALGAALLCGMVPLVAQADCNDPFGKPHEVLDFHVKMKRADWRALVASSVRNIDSMAPDGLECMDEFPEFPAEFRCGANGQWLQIAVRKKRGTERGVEAPEKPPLKFDLNEDFMGKQPAAKGQRWPAAFGELGYRKLSLNNGQSNKAPDRVMLLPVLLQEFVALRLLRREVPSTPGVAYAKVTLYTEDQPAGEYHGVYILIEDIDRTAIRRRWGQADGRLIKQSKSNCSPETVYDDGAPNGATDSFSTWAAKNPATFGANWPAESAKGLDLDTLLRQEAIREIIVNGDDTNLYSALATKQGNNWIAFDPRSGLRQYIPWDLDLSFGQQMGNCAPTPLKCAPTTPLLRHCATSMSTLGKLTVCQQEVQKRYLQVMCQLTKGTLSGAEILKEWDKAYTAVAAVVPLEKDLIWAGKNPADPTIDKSFGAEYLRLKTWIPERVRSVQQQLTMRGVACSPGCTAGEKETCRYLSCAGERRCENNSWTECRPLGMCPIPPDGGVSVAGQGPGDAGASRDGAVLATGGTSGAPDAGGSTGTVGTVTNGTGGTGAGGMPGGGIARRDAGHAGVGGGAADPHPVDDKDGRGCSCHMAGTGRAGGTLNLLGLSLLALVARRIRSKGQPRLCRQVRGGAGPAERQRGSCGTAAIDDESPR